MAGKHAHYLASYQSCLAKADLSPPKLRTTWLAIADTYRLLLVLENDFPSGGDWTRTDRGRCDPGRRP